MSYHVYVLRNADGRLYVGSTNDLKRRLTEHQQGLSRWTSGRGPWQLVHEEQFTRRSEAVQRERELKSGQGRQWLAAVLKRESGSA